MEVDEKEEKVQELITICRENPEFGDRIHDLIRNTPFSQKKYSDLTYSEFCKVYQAAKINSELFMEDCVKLYALIFDTYDKRLIDRKICQKFKTIIC